MSSIARDVATRYVDRLTAGAPPEELATFFTEDAEWFIPGDTATVPWIGHRNGHAEIAEWFRRMGELTVPHTFAVHTVVGDGDRCVMLGSLRTEVRATRRIIESDFAVDIQVRGGLISRYHMFEDTWAVARACR